VTHKSIAQTIAEREKELLALKAMQASVQSNSFREPWTWGYTRVSHLDSVGKIRVDRSFDPAMSIPAQVEKIKHWHEYQTKLGDPPPKMGIGAMEGGQQFREDANVPHVINRTGPSKYPGIFVDYAVSAYSISFAARPAGAELMKVARPGDTIVFPRLDRAFRNTQDFLNVANTWQDMGVKIVFLDPNWDLRTANGWAAAQMSCVFSEWESAIKSERMKDARVQSWFTGTVKFSGKRCVGWKTNTTIPSARGKTLNYHRDLIPCWEERGWMKHIVDNWKSRRWAAEYFESKLANREGREPRPSPYLTFDKRIQTQHFTERYFDAWRKLYVNYNIPLTPDEVVER